ncbi:MAG: hypothetical protein J0J10_26220 [Bosea sp.]|uniref:hypothetical protein n=1 Tax=Bosea sp. (in: a-proteobacteria) TaxID=1871050 RepID=UPI001AD20C72|nr:hypothetical protein [Bosea sp. (in: a-proteobacteria)]MBN9472262.1 hypothetical protein [Bosea sp. (in: a-proteobacteria)]
MAERDAQILALASRVDELENMVEGLIAYIAITTPPDLVQADDQATREFIDQNSAGTARSIAKLIQSQIGGPIATSATGHGARQALYRIECVRENAQAAGLYRGQTQQDGV